MPRQVDSVIVRGISLGAGVVLQGGIRIIHVGVIRIERNQNVQ